MPAQPSRRSLITGIAATGAGALLPVTATAGDVGSVSEGLAYRTAADLVRALADRQVSSRELVDAAIARIEALARPEDQRGCGPRFRPRPIGRECSRRGTREGREEAAARPADDGQG